MRAALLILVLLWGWHPLQLHGARAFGRGDSELRAARPSEDAVLAGGRASPRIGALKLPAPLPLDFPPHDAPPLGSLSLARGGGTAVDRANVVARAWSPGALIGPRSSRGPPRPGSRT